LWFVIQLTKPYTYATAVNLSIVNTPNQIAIDTVKINIPFEVKANGFKLWTYNLSKKSIDVDYNLFEEKPQELIIKTSVIKSILIEKGTFDSSTFEFLDANFSIPYTIKDSKKVPVISKIDYQFDNGYNSLEEMKLVPDSVLISGSKKDLAKVSAINTSSKKLAKVNQDLNGRISLVDPGQNIKLSDQEVSFSLNVTKFSEKSLETDIEVINVPDSLNLSIYPQKAKLSFLVSLEAFDKVTELDFKVICDYNKRYSEEAIMIPVLKDAPAGIKNIKLNTKKVDYLLVKN